MDTTHANLHLEALSDLSLEALIEKIEHKQRSV